MLTSLFVYVSFISKLPVFLLGYTVYR